ncbi:NTPase KAP family P-loop domain-containing protein 1 isoform X3 [Xiphophorus hellerii]|uniref:NTPase KAP family P-loop domain-containing protein 1 isoform X3 n=1 Tax=Xiphophorus hellerii TaxID=8084 RepID=UPI0013B3F183|nr:NTPase KAP family P-loop domain-containing protein 1 isoform X3 [Xiphophorus hellerii]XP_032416426.1 NTPase KAP family P-loop domain-containing protein 1 isoform X3 [Xiphophorus hellerii]
MKEATTDNIYAYALSKTLTKVSSPATVGLYSSCQDRLYVILDQIGVYTNRESLRIEEKSEKGQKPRAVKHSVKDFLVLIVRLLFYTPVWTTENQNHHNVRFLYVNFSAWHFAGSDMLWAGIAIRLFNAMQMNFGKLQLALYRVTQYDKRDEVKAKEVKDIPNNWISKKVCCCPLWFFLLFIIVVPVVLVVVFFVWVFPNGEIKPEELETEANSEMNLLEGFAIASLGVPAVTLLRFAFQMVKNLIFSQEQNIKRGMDSERISNQLGFMNEVRKEMWFLTQFIKFMEVFERRRIRIVLKITNLDRCSPKKIVGVLEAINILLSDEESPVLSILAVNPNVLLKKVKFAENCFCKEDRAHALLNRIVTLAFTVPPMCENSKRSLFNSLNNTPGISEDSFLRWNRDRRTTSSIDLSVVAIEELKESNPLINTNRDTLGVKEDKLETMVQTILSNGEKKLNKYMLDDAISMKRTISSVWVTVIIMKLLKKEFPDPEHTAAWVVLANQWPCRFSWILQCVEDEKQRAAIDQQNMSSDDSKTLWEVFSESREELYVMRTHIEDLLEQDGDPEVFEALLKDDEFEFTLKNLEIFQVGMVNLDQSVKRELALIRGTSRLENSGWMRNIAPLPVTSLIKMTTDDICEEMERMKLDSTYRETVKKHKLNGSALVFGDTEDLKVLLDQRCFL